MAWVEEYTADPRALHYTWKASADGVDKGGMEMWQIGDTMYLLITDEDGSTNCTSFSSSDPDSGLKMGNMTIHKTASKLADVATCYQKEMAVAGWTPTGVPTIMEGLSTMDFAKDSQRATVTITSEGEGSQVLINVSEEE